MSQIGEMCFRRTWRAIAFPGRQESAVSYERRARMNDWLYQASEAGWLKWDSLNSGTLGLIVFLTNEHSPMRKQANNALARRTFQRDPLGDELYGLLGEHRDFLSHLALGLDYDRQSQEALFEAFKHRFSGLSKFITTWLNVEMGADLSPFLTTTTTDARDDIGRPVQPTPRGLAYRLMHEGFQQILLPQNPETTVGLVLRRLLELVQSMPTRYGLPSWSTNLEPIEQEFLRRSLRLDDQERFVLLATVYGSFTTDEIAIAMEGFQWAMPRKVSDQFRAEQRVLDILRRGWREIFRRDSGVESSRSE